jgi:Domain of unknown function (DUF5666)
MNAGPADTHSPHLDLGDLVAEVTGQAVDDRAREHLASCGQCRAEANRWNLVADGVRGLAAATPQVAQPARPRRAGQRVLAGPWRPAVLVAGSAAAAFALLVGVGAATGLVHVRLSGPGTGTALTAVTGCTQLEQADGTLEQVNGSSLVIKTASGQPVTVTTTAATKVGEIGASGALLGDITDGSSVTVVGPSSDGTVAAYSVLIANPERQHPQPPPGMAVVKGTVSDASTAGFTVVTPGGARVPVTTSSDTVLSDANASLGQLPAGATIRALGYAGPDGTLSARGVVGIRQLPQGGPQLHTQAHVRVQNCSPASIDDALALGG